MATDVRLVDPFELPDWLGTSAVTWTALTPVRAAQRIEGSLGDTEHDTSHDGRVETLRCDLMAADVAYPAPLLADSWRRQAHLAWEHGQVLLLDLDGRLTLAVPGTAYSADGVLETIGRLAQALGAAQERFRVSLRL